MLVDHVEERFPVGTTTFTLPVRPTRQFGSSTFNPNTLNGPGPVLTLSEIAFSVYYPTKTDLPAANKRYLDWLIRPIKGSMIGMSYYTGISYWLMLPIFYLYSVFLKIPIYSNAPLLNPVSSSEKDTHGESKWPLVFFSHGLAGSRTAYSHICARIASSGKVVIVMEHRDGSSTACFPKLETGSVVSKYYVHPRDTSYGVENQWDFRQDQLSFRRFEVYHTYATLKELLVNGNRGSLQTIDDTPIDWSFLTGMVNVDELQVVGHSFGAATLLSILSNPPPEGFTALPISHALILDPWLEPFPSPGPVPYIKNSSIKMAVITSEGFTLWKSHFERQLELFKAWNDTPVYTILRSIHMSFSDYPIITPRALQSAAPDKVIRIIGSLSTAFLDDRTDQCLSEYNTRKMEIEWTKAKFRSPSKRRLVGELGDIIVH